MFLVPVLFFTHPTGFRAQREYFFLSHFKPSKSIFSFNWQSSPPPPFPPLPLLLDLHFSRQLATVHSFYFGHNWKDRFWLKGIFFWKWRKCYGSRWSSFKVALLHAMWTQWGLKFSSAIYPSSQPSVNALTPGWRWKCVWLCLSSIHPLSAPSTHLHINLSNWTRIDMFIRPFLSSCPCHGQ